MSSKSRRLRVATAGPRERAIAAIRQSAGATERPAPRRVAAIAAYARAAFRFTRLKSRRNCAVRLTDRTRRLPCRLDSQSPGFSVVPVELDDRLLRSAELHDLAAPCRLDRRHGSRVRHQRPEVRSATSGRLFEHDADRVSSIVKPRASSCLAASSRTRRSTSTRTVTFIIASVGMEHWPARDREAPLYARARRRTRNTRHSSAWNGRSTPIPVRRQRPSWYRIEAGSSMSPDVSCRRRQAATVAPCAASSVSRTFMHVISRSRIRNRPSTITDSTQPGWP